MFPPAVGGLAGLTLTSHRGAKQAAAATAAGAVALAVVDGVARALQRPNEIPALWSRIAASAALAAPAGWSVARVAGVGPRTVGVMSGACAGLLGIRPQKVVLGPLVGLAVGGVLGRRQAPGSVVAASTVLVYRVLSAAVFRDPQVILLAERVDAAELQFVVPRASWTRYVGTGYVLDLAAAIGGIYVGIYPGRGRSGAHQQERARPARPLPDLHRPAVGRADDARRARVRRAARRLCPRRRTARGACLLGLRLRVPRPPLRGQPQNAGARAGMTPTSTGITTPRTTTT